MPFAAANGIAKHIDSVIFNRLLLCLLASCQPQEGLPDRNTLQGTDYRLFQGTPLWDVAQAVRDDDAPHVAELGESSGLNVDAPEPRFGKTVLMLTVANGDYAACQALLRLGAAPNAHDRYNGTSPILEAACRSDPAFVKLLLAHGGNPNDVETGPRRPGNRQRNTPLTLAAGSSLAMVAALLSAGANIRYENEFGTTALSRSLMQDQYGVALYLLQHGADSRKPILQRPTPDGPQAVYLTQFLAEVRQPGVNEEEINRILAFIHEQRP